MKTLRLIIFVFLASLWVGCEKSKPEVAMALDSLTESSEVVFDSLMQEEPVEVDSIGGMDMDKNAPEKSAITADTSKIVEPRPAPER